jgi:hypothetical protein
MTCSSTECCSSLLCLVMLYFALLCDASCGSAPADGLLAGPAAGQNGPSSQLPLQVRGREGSSLLFTRLRVHQRLHSPFVVFCSAESIPSRERRFSLPCLVMNDRYVVLRLSGLSCNNHVTFRPCTYLFCSPPFFQSASYVPRYLPKPSTGT